MSEISIIGLDLAKQVFQVHGADKAGRCLLRKQLKRREVLAFLAKLSPCMVAMEACGTAHHWAREIAKLGHEARLIPPAYVKAYVKRGKNDAIDAEAIGEAASRPSMRFVPVRTVEQQSLAMLHRARDLLIKNRTRLVNALRSHLAEFGSKAGNGYLRRLLALGATSLLRSLKNKATPLALWVQGLLARRSKRATTVALANKLARIASNRLACLTLSLAGIGWPIPAR